jgi:hypothetical protein
MMNNGIYNQTDQPMVGAMPTPGQMGVNPNQMVPNQINPKAFSNADAISGMYGNANPNTFTRTVGQTMNQPIPTPLAIQDDSQITPNQGFNNI